MGAAAKALVEREHGVGAVAERYVAALEQAAGGGVVREAVLRDVAAAAADTGLAVEPLADELVAASLIPVSDTVSVSDTKTRFFRRAPMWAWLGALYAAATTIQLALALRAMSE